MAQPSCYPRIFSLRHFCGDVYGGDDDGVYDGDGGDAFC